MKKIHTRNLVGRMFENSELQISGYLLSTCILYTKLDIH